MTRTRHGADGDSRAVPAAPVPSIAFRVPAAAHAAPIARHRIVEFAAANGAGADLAARVALAVTEAVANVVRHAYPAGGGPVICEADIEGGALEVVVADRGEGFRPSHLPGLGAGLAIIADACDELTIRQRDHEGVEVWMRFVIEPERAAPADDLWL